MAAIGNYINRKLSVEVTLSSAQIKKILHISLEDKSKSIERFESELPSNFEFSFLKINKDEIIDQFSDWQKKFDIIRFEANLGSLAYGLKAQSSVENYNLKYVDVWENYSGEWYSHNLLVEFFRPLLVNSGKIKKIQGGVMIIGQSDFMVPLIFVLCRMGYKRISIYDIDDNLDEMVLQNSIRTILGSVVDIVRPGTLTLLPAIYTLCIVHKSAYDAEDLKEISYFNFLSPSPVVLDLDWYGAEAFLFKELVALGGSVISHEDVWKSYNDFFIQKCKAQFKDIK